MSKDEPTSTQSQASKSAIDTSSLLRIVVRNMAGDELSIEVVGSTTVFEMKTRINELNDAHIICLQQLVITNDDTGAFEITSDSRSVHSYGLVNDSTIDLVILQAPPLVEDWFSGKFGQKQLELTYGGQEACKTHWTGALALAQRHDSEAKWQCVIGLCHLNGWGVCKDHKKAVEWFKLAADQEHAEAQFQLGVCNLCSFGIDRRCDKATTFEFFRRAANQGHAQAQNKLGLFYSYGFDFDQDKRKAAEWYQKAADQGLADAQYRLGRCYYFGDGVAADLSEAVELWRKAADGGHADAQYELAECYLDGKGVAKDISSAATWYRKAAVQGLGHAQSKFDKFCRGVVDRDRKK